MTDHDEIVLVDDNHKSWTAADVRRWLDKGNAEVRAKYGDRYRVVFSWSPYWRRGMFFAQRRVCWFFWCYIRMEDTHRKRSWIPNHRVTAFNPYYFLKYVFDDLEQQVVSKRVTITPSEKL